MKSVELLVHEELEALCILCDLSSTSCDFLVNLKRIDIFLCLSVFLFWTEISHIEIMTFKPIDIFHLGQEKQKQKTKY